MLKRSLLLWQVWLTAAALITGCADGRATDPPPTISLSDRTCEARPDLAAAHKLLLQSDNEVSVTLDANAACLQVSGGGKSVYAVFRLPDSPVPYIVSVTSTPLGQGLFSPHLLLLDANGGILREVPRDSFLFHGSSLYAGIRAHTGERYLVVASDPDSVGQQVSQIKGNTQATMSGTGTVFFTIYTGSEATSKFTYAHNGKIKVSAQPIPKVN